MKEITIEDVESFLDSMHVKIDIYGMVFAERHRCQETMRMLGINELVAKISLRHWMLLISQSILMMSHNGDATFGRLVKILKVRKFISK